MRLVVVGTGLIGGSFANAARRRKLFDRVLGIEPDPARARQALALGLVDEVVEEVPAAADAVLVAGPGETIAPWVLRLADHPGILFDTGSIKAPILQRVRAELSTLPPRFVPCHPIAGKEKSGPGAADPDLFLGQPVILTPQPETDPAACAAVADWWQRLGATVCHLDAVTHDEIYAVTSHLPHLVAFAYLQQLEERHQGHTGGGFRDFSRIGGADPDMWAPIFDMNRAALLPALDRLQTDLTALRAMVEQGDVDGLRAYIGRARDRRRAFEHD
jgi:prephenate dehydrogenase